MAHNTPPGTTGRANVQVPSLPDIGGLNLKNGQQEDEDITTIRKWIEEKNICGRRSKGKTYKVKKISCDIV